MSDDGAPGKPASPLLSRRFVPLFVTLFLGAFNDNVYKNALILLVAFYWLGRFDTGTDLLINLAALLFILPYFLFSATAGQLADKYDKAQIIRWVKSAEVLIMLFGALALWLESLPALYFMLFLMGSQSAFFSPVKYSILPQHLPREDLVGGNAYVEMGTFCAIILGLLLANFLTATEHRELIVGVSVVGFALLGRFSAGFVPAAKPPDPNIRINRNMWQQTRIIVGYAAQDHTILHAIVGVSWFWFLGSVWLTQMPNFSREHLYGGADVTTLVLCIFSLGTALGTILCERLSGRKLELGLVPIGALGLSLASLDIFAAMPLSGAGVIEAQTALASAQPAAEHELLSVGQFLQLGGSYRVLIDLTLIGLFGGFFIVPLMALVQQRTNENTRAQVIAANNILNSLFMVSAALLGMITLEILEMSIPQLFLLVAIANLLVCAYIFYQVPEFVLRAVIWLLSHTLYRVAPNNFSALPVEGAALMICNSNSSAAPLLLASACPRPIRFVAESHWFDHLLTGFVLRNTKSIRVTPSAAKSRPAKENQSGLSVTDANSFESGATFDEVAAALAAGELVCLFNADQSVQAEAALSTVLRDHDVAVFPVTLAPARQRQLPSRWSLTQATVGAEQGLPHFITSA